MSRIGFGLGRFQATTDPGLARTYLNAIRAALAGGIRIFDTAPNYAHGLADLLLGKALAERTAAGIDNEEIVVCSKTGYPAGDEELDAFVTCADDDHGCPLVTSERHCLAPDFISSQLQSSLERLGLPAVDIFYLHNPEEQRAAFGQSVFEERLVQALNRCGELQITGAIREIGIACSQDVHDQYDPDSFLEVLFDCAAQAEVKIGAFQVPFSLSCPDALWPKGGRKGRSLLEVAEVHAVPVFASAALGGMRLPPKSMKLLARMFDDIDTPARIAMQFTRSAPGIACALFGSCDPDHVKHLAELDAFSESSFRENYD